MENEKLDKQHVRTLTTGWRLTLPAQLRRALGWEQGTMLRVTVTGDQLALSKGADVPQGSPASNSNSGSTCYIGSGGKIVIPSEVRESTGWQVGERLSVRNQGQEIVISPCCQKHRCRSCGSLHGVTEVIDNLFLCSDCWSRYLLKN